jgi:GDP-L-fucose synthase
MTSKKILFTGGNGFIGRQIIPFIQSSGYEVIRPRSTQVRLEIDEDVSTLFDNGQHYDAIIHAAIVGGRRDIDDDWKVLHTNLNMFETLYKYVDHTDMFINLDSGASYGRPAHVEDPSTEDFGKVIPQDPYGFSKYVIAKRVLNNPKSLNLRIFGCFGHHEDSHRFFSTNINRYIDKKPIRLIKDRKMDFIFADDLYKIIQYYLDGNDGPRDVNCVYDRKYMLSDIAEIINHLGPHRVEIEFEGEYQEFPYTGKSNDLPIKYDGLEKGIRKVYEEYLRQRNI